MPIPDRKPRSIAPALALALGLSGCAVVPKSRVDDCAKVAQALRAENAQLKDATLSLKGENADLAQRSLDDGRKIAALEDANGRFEASVQAYIDEREGLNASFEKFRRIAQGGAKAPSTALNSRLKSFVEGHEGTALDPAGGAVVIDADRLFVAGSDRLTAGASALLDDLGALLGEPEARQLPLMVSGHAAPSSVRAASTAGPDAARPGDLSLARAQKVRDVLAERSRRDPSRIGVAGLGTSRPIVDADDARLAARNARIEVELADDPRGPDRR